MTKWTNDLADSSFTDWSANIKTLRIVSKCHLLLCECFYTIKQIFKANSGMNSSSVAVKSVFKSYFTIPAALSYSAIRYNKSRAIFLIKLSFSSKHSKIVFLFAFTTFKSYFAIKLKLRSERYLELASFTEMNLLSTFATISLSWLVGSRIIKHWKHSSNTAFAPFFKLFEIFEHTLSWEMIRISIRFLSKELEYLLKRRRSLRIATWRKGSWTPPISY